MLYSWGAKQMQRWSNKKGQKISQGLNKPVIQTNSFRGKQWKYKQRKTQTPAAVVLSQRWWWIQINNRDDELIMCYKQRLTEDELKSEGMQKRSMCWCWMEKHKNFWSVTVCLVVFEHKQCVLLAGKVVQISCLYEVLTPNYKNNKPELHWTSYETHFCAFFLLLFIMFFLYAFMWMSGTCFVTAAITSLISWKGSIKYIYLSILSETWGTYFSGNIWKPLSSCIKPPSQ